MLRKEKTKQRKCHNHLFVPQKAISSYSEDQILVSQFKHTTHLNSSAQLESPESVHVL